MSDNQYPPYGSGQPGYGQAGQGQPGQGQPPYGGQSGYAPPQQGRPAQPPYGQPPQGQPPYGQPGQGQPPQQGPPYGGQPGYPPPPQGQPGYPPPPQQGQQTYPQPPHQGQQTYPQPPHQGQQTYPQQGQFPPGGQPGGQWGPGSGGPQQQWPQASPPYGRQPRKGGNQIIFLAGGGIAVVAIIGVVLALVFGGGGDDKNAGPGPLPTNKPTTPAKDADQGIDAGHGVYVSPATGFIRKTDTHEGVYLVKQGQGTFWLQVVQGKPGESGATELPRLIDSQKKTTTASTFKAGEVKTEKPSEGPDSKVTAVTSQAWSGSVTSQSGTTRLSGYIAIVDTKDGRISAVQVVVRKDLESKLAPDIQAMMQSVVKSQ